MAFSVFLRQYVPRHPSRALSRLSYQQWSIRRSISCPTSSPIRRSLLMMIRFFTPHHSRRVSISFITIFAIMITQVLLIKPKDQERLTTISTSISHLLISPLHSSLMFIWRCSIQYIFRSITSLKSDRLRPHSWLFINKCHFNASFPQQFVWEQTLVVQVLRLSSQWECFELLY